MKVKGTELRLADVIRLGDYAFADAIVCNITKTEVTLRRPYMMNCDFAYTGGVVTSIGLEEWNRSIVEDFDRIARGPDLK